MDIQTKKYVLGALALSMVLSGCKVSSTNHIFTPKEGGAFVATDTQAYQQQSEAYREKMNPYQIAQNCEDLVPQHYEQELFFPDPGEVCAWNQNGNGGIQNGEIRARTRQEITYNIPENAVICNIEFSSDEQNMRFDDEILLLLNDRVLLSSDDYSDLFPVVDGFSTWSWDAIYGTPYVINGNPGFCLGEEAGLASCEVPETETWGHIALSFEPELMYELSSDLSEEAQLKFAFVTTGDNDGSDCRHEDYTFSVAVDYVVPEE